MDASSSTSAVDHVWEFASDVAIHGGVRRWCRPSRHRYGALGTVGRRVVLLERGVRSSTRAQQLNDGDHEGEPYNGLAGTRHRQVGGTVNVWNVPLHGEAGVGAKYVL